MTTLMALSFIHPHPALRGLFFLALLGGLLMQFVILVVLRYQRHAEMISRLKSLEDKLDRLTPPPPGK